MSATEATASEDPSAAHLGGGEEFEAREFGFWLYLMTDAIIFALLFATYIVMRGNIASGPDASALFDIRHTAGETLLLLLSSITFGFASLASLGRQSGQVIIWLVITTVLGVGFVVMEIIEFSRYDRRWRRPGCQRFPVGLLHAGRHTWPACQRRHHHDRGDDRPGRHQGA